VILPEKARMYAAYARSHSLRGDLKVLWDTLVVVARR